MTEHTHTLNLCKNVVFFNDTTENTDKLNLRKSEILSMTQQNALTLNLCKNEIVSVTQQNALTY